MVFTGHQHLVFPGNFADMDGVDNDKGTLMGKPAVMGGFWGSHMGLIDLMIERGADGKWAIASHESSARPIYERVERKNVPLVENVPAVIAAVQKTHDETLEYVRRAVGETAAPALFLLCAGRRRSVGSDREPGADLVYRADDEGHRMGRPADPVGGGPVQGPAAAAVRTITPTSPSARSPSRTSPTCICTRTRPAPF